MDERFIPNPVIDLWAPNFAVNFDPPPPDIENDPNRGVRPVLQPVRGRGRERGHVDENEEVEIEAVEIGRDLVNDRVDELIEAFRGENIDPMPNYAIFNQYIMGRTNHNFNSLLEYTRNRMWLERWTSYLGQRLVNWRDHGFGRPMVSRNPDIYSDEASALHLWVDSIDGDLETFINETNNPPPQKYQAMIDYFIEHR